MHSDFFPWFATSLSLSLSLITCSISLSSAFWNFMMMCLGMGTYSPHYTKYSVGPFRLEIHILQFWKVILNYFFNDFLLTFSLCLSEELINSDAEPPDVVFSFYFSFPFFFVIFLYVLEKYLKLNLPHVNWVFHFCIIYLISKCFSLLPESFLFYSTLVLYYEGYNFSYPYENVNFFSLHDHCFLLIASFIHSTSIYWAFTIC